jgi:uncharacterized protein (DUF1697 family)
MFGHGAFLRGMNLGGRRITNDDLRAAVRELGFERVQTFRASGNVVFDGGGRSDESLRKELERGLQRLLGYAVPTFIRSRRELLALAEEEPFPASGEAGKLQVALLRDVPAPQDREQVMALSSESDRLAFGAKELFWLPAGPISDSALDWKAIEKALGPTTTRTKGTIEQLVAKYLQD